MYKRFKSPAETLPVSIPRELEAVVGKKVWAIFEVDGHKKRPMSVNGRWQSSNDPKTLFTYAEAAGHLGDGKVLAVSLSLASDALGVLLHVVDLDTYKEGFPHDQLEEFLSAETYTDVSPSSKGYHLWYSFNRRQVLSNNGAGIDCVTGFVTLSGNVHRDAPILHEDLPEKAVEDNQSYKTKDLMSKPDQQSIMVAYNLQNPIEVVLLKYGFTMRGNKWLSPDSGTNSPGGTTFPSFNNPWNLFWTHNQTGLEWIPLHPATGRPIAVDAYELTTHYEYDGDKSRAGKALVNTVNAIDKETGEILDQTINEYNAYLRMVSTTKNSTSLEVVSAKDLMSKQFPELQWAIEGVIQQGTNILFGKPKKGKSWLALLMAMHVAAGQPVFGRETSNKRVLFMGLEDNESRLQKRLRIAVSSSSLKLRDFWENFGVATACADIKGGLIAQLDDHMAQYPDTGLIVIDMLKNIKPEEATRGSSLYQEDAKVGHSLREIAHKYNGLSILVVHHMRKMESEDPLDTASGTTGLTGSFDNLLALVEVKNDGRFLFVAGKETEENQFQLHMHDGGMYSLEASDAPARANVNGMSDSRRRVYDVIPEHPERKRRTDIIKESGVDETIVDQKLKSMVEASDPLIKKAGRGYYTRTEIPFYDPERSWGNPEADKGAPIDPDKIEKNAKMKSQLSENEKIKMENDEKRRRDREAGFPAMMGMSED